ncbi:MAG: NUDIX hydrolase [Candidatus Azambacteria bacterium GW2011_GWE1_42_9]|nr:MAG: NUDIX hydrolase [Candidatus Azambacteria bacterium GW2011_GWF1_41_10]KKS49177.1 MAG: NUDIX hydrolase [Candidatus Azambacteria bacterium GW2011_GWF2_42_22]KKS73414.1 MAG: NUDIX hydrolase [Candidatus Azambacteria bacterium GW2011_GWB1_42_72]KKS79696.1 MAG: NUDIX hydrolase [Candidatus Azambacteria bacterium GW2011_GWE1_42_9]KKT03120.1 MAG: NUDIX hydrolase [Candidatus Azambacteria bacterium GW2011_GWD1_43_18]KKT12038.1 MAG: NUDIX hydrolase [Candidatus Azambacteria bacterium GW2011_GWC2_43_
MDKELHRITSTCIIHKDGKFLLLQRSFNKKAFPGKWTVPGGGLSTDDYINTPKTTSDHWYYALENSLRREIKEEAGIEVGKMSYCCDITFIRPDGVPVIVLSFYAPYQNGEIKLDNESINYAWATFEELKNYDLIEGISDEIKMVNDLIKDHLIKQD